MPPRANTAILPPPARLQMATSMPQQTATSTKTPAAVGIKLRAPHTTQATQAPTPLPLTALDRRSAAAGPLSAEAEAVGNPDRPVLAGPIAVVVAASEVAGEDNGAAANESTLGRGIGKQTDKVSEDGMSLKPHRTALTTRLLFLALIIPLAACNSNKAPEKPAITVFASPEDAGSALIAAAKTGDDSAALAIFGSDSKDVIHSADPVEDKNAVAEFVAKYGVMHRWRKMPDNSQILIVGADNFPFAIPLKQNAEGKWFFDTAAGKDEVLSRRIGRNELAVIDICNAVVDAQVHYFAHPHDGQPAKLFAVKFISDDGKQNGLYWKTAEGQPVSPLGPMAASATAEGYQANPNGHTAFHGYYFKMLDGQTANAPAGARDYVVNGKKTGGFAFIAYPAEYGNSGIMSFILNQDGVLLERDLGKTTTEMATAMTKFDPDPSWKIVE